MVKFAVLKDSMTHAKNTRDVKVEPLLFENYIHLIRSSIDNPIFRKFYCSVNGKKTEVLDEGRLSCAAFVTFVLKLFSLVSDIQITVHRAMDDMKKNGWQVIQEPKVGAVIVWAEKTSVIDKDSTINAPVHKHIGFYIGNGQAVSNSSMAKSPVVHLWDFRPVDSILWHTKLDDYQRRGVDYTRDERPEEFKGAPITQPEDVLANQ